MNQSILLSLLTGSLKISTKKNKNKNLKHE